MKSDRTPGLSCTAHIVKLNEKPCAIKFVEEVHGFIVGTYECLPDVHTLKRRFPKLSEVEATDIFEFTNHRIGSLNFLRHDSGSDSTIIRLQIAHPCKHGGIFDMSIIANNVIFAAHANGYVAKYIFENYQFKFLSSIQVTTIPNALLTSIDTCDCRRDEDIDLFVLVGDSQGLITLLDPNGPNKVLASCKVTQDGDPVWQVKFVPNQTQANEKLILVAAEDSSWYIYKITLTNGTTTFQKIYRNQDFKAGVTSICFIEDGTRQFSALIGSYDESIYYYEVKILDGEAGFQVQSALDSPVEIAGGGIWRLNLVGKEHVYIAAMYAGTYRLSLSDLLDGDRSRAIKCDNIIELGEVEHGDNKPAPLHYGVDLSPSDSLVCIVDYNNNSCIFVKLP